MLSLMLIGRGPASGILCSDQSGHLSTASMRKVASLKNVITLIARILTSI